MKVLISAYACEPGAGSEPGVGWVWASAAAAKHEVWVITRRNNAEKVAAAVLSSGLPIHVVAHDLPPAIVRLKRRGLGVHIYYALWQITVRRLARELHSKEHFDVAHHLTFAVDWFPAGVVGIEHLPSVWGPVGGASRFHSSFLRWLGFRESLHLLIRRSVGGVGRATFGQRNAKRAAVMVAQNDDVAHRFRRFSPVVEPNTAIGADFAQADGGLSGRPVREGSVVRALFVGRIARWKGINLALRAIASHPTAELDVLGGGPRLASAERASARLGLTGRVRFHGVVDRPAVAAAMASADVLLQPSFHDSAGWALAEAIVSRLPYVVVDNAGPGTIHKRCNGGLALEPTQLTPSRVAAALDEAASEAGSSIEVLLSSRLPDLINSWYERAKRESSPQTSPRPQHTAGRLLYDDQTPAGSDAPPTADNP